MVTIEVSLSLIDSTFTQEKEMPGKGKSRECGPIRWKCGDTGKRVLTDAAKVYGQLRASQSGLPTGELSTILTEVDRRFWSKRPAIPKGTTLDPANPAHKSLIKQWLRLRDNVIEEMMRGSLGVTDAQGHWEFTISGDSIQAVSTPGAKCADLANGALCSEDPVNETVVIDVTSAFPKWVKQALKKQAASGIRFIQPTPRHEVRGYSASQFDLGYGNCHGTALQIFQLFKNVPISKWSPTWEETLYKPPKGVPTVFGDFPPREQAITILDDSDQEPEARADVTSQTTPGGGRWSATLDVGDRTIMKRVTFIGGKKVKTPSFGDWGNYNSKRKDHSVVALGRVGKNRVYVFQKMSPLNPYFINVVEIAKYDWYSIPPSKIQTK